MERRCWVTGLDDSRARAYCACCRWGWFGHFFSILSPSLWETARYRLKYCLKGPLNSKQSTNQIHNLKPQNAGLVDVKTDLNSKRSKGIFVLENLKNKHSY